MLPTIYSRAGRQPEEDTWARIIKHSLLFVEFFKPVSQLSRTCLTHFPKLKITILNHGPHIKCHQECALAISLKLMITLRNHGLYLTSHDGYGTSCMTVILVWRTSRKIPSKGSECLWVRPLLACWVPPSSPPLSTCERNKRLGLSPLFAREELGSRLLYLGTSTVAVGLPVCKYFHVGMKPMSRR